MFIITVYISVFVFVGMWRQMWASACHGMCVEVRRQMWASARHGMCLEVRRELVRVIFSLPAHESQGQTQVAWLAGKNIDPLSYHTSP